MGVYLYNGWSIAFQLRWNFTIWRIPMKVLLHLMDLNIYTGRHTLQNTKVWVGIIFLNANSNIYWSIGKLINKIVNIGHFALTPLIYLLYHKLCIELSNISVWLHEMLHADLCISTIIDIWDVISVAHSIPNLTQYKNIMFMFVICSIISLGLVLPTTGIQVISLWNRLGVRRVIGAGIQTFS